MFSNARDGLCLLFVLIFANSFTILIFLFADIFLIWALNEKKEINLFLIPRKTKGLGTSVIENKTSLKISPTGQIILDNVKIPKHYILPNTKGWKSVFSCLNNARYGISWGAMGAANNAWMISKDYTENRIMFGMLLSIGTATDKIKRCFF